MENSPTEGANVQSASNEPTEQAQVQQTSAEQNQETISREAQTGGQEPVSDDAANQTQNTEEKQTQQTGGESQTDDGLAKFAKSQGFDLENSSEEVKRALKIAHDNQKAFRSKSNEGPKVSDAAGDLSDGSLRAEVEQLKFQRQEDAFFADGRDPSLRPQMIEILNEKAAQFGNEYAYTLSRDLDALYGMAQAKSGALNSAVDPEQIRREERESINRQMAASAPQAHATQQGQDSTPKLTPEWFTNVYDSRNPEHIKLLQEAGLR